MPTADPSLPCSASPERPPSPCPIIATSEPGRLLAGPARRPGRGDRRPAGLRGHAQRPRQRPPPDPLRRVRHQRRRGAARGVGQPAARAATRSRSAGGPRARARATFASLPVQPMSVTYETADGHNHFHLNRAMRYSLWNLERTAQVAPGQKVGFCLYDIENAPSPSPAPDPERLRRRGHPVLRPEPAGLDRPADGHLLGVARRLRQVAGLPVDRRLQHHARALPGGRRGRPGQHDLGGRRRRRRATSRRSRPSRSSCPGWTAQPVNLAQTGAAQAVPLSAAKFGTPGRLQPALPGHVGAGQRHAQRRRRPDFPGEHPARLHARARATRAATASPTSPARSPPASRSAPAERDRVAEQHRAVGGDLGRPGQHDRRARACSSRPRWRTCPAASRGAPAPGRSRRPASTRPRPRRPRAAP